MGSNSHTLRTMLGLRSIWFLPATVLLLVAPGCGDDDENPFAPTPQEPLQAVSVAAGPFTHDGHTYYRLENSDWTTAEENAVRMLGGHLVTVDDAAEDQFLQSTFGSVRLWLGLNDAATEGTFVYTSGASFVFSNWESGEPNGQGDEDYVMKYTNGPWNDVRDLADPPGIGPIYGVVEVETPAALYVVQGPVTNPDNGHTYYRLSNSDWSDAEAFAVNVLGGHLASVTDSEENAFLLTTFANAPGSGRIWLGLNDAATEGTFVYSSGEPAAYFNWEPGEPNNSNDEDYVAMYSGNGRWVDIRDLANPPLIGNVYGVVEVP